MDHDCSKCALNGVCTRHPKVHKTGAFMMICNGTGNPTVRKKWMDQWDTEEFGHPLESRKSDGCCGKKTQVVRPIPGGVGTELKSLLSWFGQHEGPDCKCKQHAAEMDRNGIAWCEQNVNTIVGWLTEEAGKQSILGLSLDLVPGLAMTAHAFVHRAIANAKKKRNRRRHGPFAYAADGLPRFITKAQLMQDAHALAAMLPPDAPFIIGIARSGLCVATMIAMILHLPLKIFRQSTYDLIDGGNGWRLTGNTGGQGRPVVIDDTVMSGNSFKHSMPMIRQTHPNAMSAAVYVNPQAHVKPDLWAVDLPWPHVLEWNLFNSVMSQSIAFDFDGILCHDCPAGSDDDGRRYAEFLRDTKPLYPMRRTPISLIVTARLEKYRPQTIDWLARHGIAFQRLVMGPWANNQERARADIAAYKAEHFCGFMTIKHRVKPPIFAESEPSQAERIAQISGGLVVCPAAGRCF